MVLADRATRRYLGATVVSSTGDWLYSVAVVVWLYDQTGSTGVVAAAASLRLAAYVVASPIGGVLGDRHDRRRLVVGLNLALLAVLAVLTVAVGLDAPAALVVAGTVVVSTLAALYNPPMFALVPQLVDEDSLGPVNAAVATVEQVSMFAGPALGSVLVALTSVAFTFAVNAASFLAAALLLAGVTLRRGAAVAPVHTGGPEEQPSGQGRTSATRAFVEGLSAVRQS
ncbi:MAG TPA: MFS transporter, partial [Acidimicrobiales bacterium]